MIRDAPWPLLPAKKNWRRVQSDEPSKSQSDARNVLRSRLWFLPPNVVANAYRQRMSKVAAIRAGERAIRAEVERRRRNRLLTGMLDALDAEYGPVDGALVAKYTELL
jgi:hypothetical protein